MTDREKVTTLADAASLIPDSATIGIGGNSQSRKPMALIRELVRQGRTDLTIVTFLGGIDIELLLAGGCVKQVRAALVSLDLIGLAPIYASIDPAKCVTETEATLVYGMRASAAGLSFLPSLGILHTDIPKLRPDLRLVTSPYSGQEVIAMPAVRIDFALIHTSWATPLGTAGTDGAPVLDRLMSEAANQTIVTAEHILPNEVPLGDVLVRRSRTSAVVEAKYGAHPTGCFPDYRQDIAFLADYAACAKDRGADAALTLFADSPSYEETRIDVERILVHS
ncbi:MAG TPA: CoA-transferase [Acidimicrobiales bacterium]|nr:CoA-transferase [Acidimicrobiales bacterium]